MACFGVLASPNRRLDWTVLFALLLLGFAYSFWVSTISTRMLQSYHGLHHAAQVYQVLNGIVPPTNPQVAGAVSAKYWPWHALVAGLCALFGATPFKAIAALNAASLGASLAAMYAIGRRRLGLSPRVSLLGAFAMGALLSPLRTIARFLQGVTGSDEIFALLVSASEDWRYGFWTDKFFNQSSFPISLALMLVLVFLFWEQRRRAWVSVLGAALVVLTGVCNPLSLLAFDFFVLATVAAEWRSFDAGGQPPAARLRALVGRLLSAYWPVVLGNLVVLPYGMWMSSQIGRGARFGGSLHAIGRHFERAGETITVSLLWLFLGLVLYSRRGDRRALRMSLWLLLLTVAAASVRITVINEYKLVVIGVVPAAVVGMLLVSRIQGRRRIQLFAAGITLALAQWLGMAYQRHALHWANEELYVFSGSAIRLAPRSPEAKDLQEVCDWLRDRTPVTAWVVAEPQFRDATLIPVISQRRQLVAQASMETVRIKQFGFLSRVNAKWLSMASGGEFILAPDDPDWIELKALLGESIEVYAIAPTGHGAADAANSRVLETGYYSLFRLTLAAR